VKELLSVMKEIADRKGEGVKIANVAERYVLQTVGVGSVLVGVRNSNWVASNVATYSFVLEEGEMDEIRKVIGKRKGPKGDVWDIERGIV